MVKANREKEFSNKTVIYVFFSDRIIKILNNDIFFSL